MEATLRGTAAESCHATTRGDSLATRQPGSTGRCGILCASAALVLLLAYLYTLAVGVTSYARAPADLDALLAEADGLMYEVKHGGSNRVLQPDLIPPMSTTLPRQFPSTAGVTRKQ